MGLLETRPGVTWLSAKRAASVDICKERGKCRLAKVGLLGGQISKSNLFEEKVQHYCLLNMI